MVEGTPGEGRELCFILPCHLATHHWQANFMTLTRSLKSSKSTFSQPFGKRKCIIEVVRVGSIIVFHLSKLSNAKFLIPCDVIFLQGGCGGNLKLITHIAALTKPRVGCDGHRVDHGYLGGAHFTVCMATDHVAIAVEHKRYVTTTLLTGAPDACQPAVRVLESREHACADAVHERFVVGCVARETDDAGVLHAWREGRGSRWVRIGWLTVLLPWSMDRTDRLTDWQQQTDGRTDGRRDWLEEVVLGKLTDWETSQLTRWFTKIKWLVDWL